MAGTAGAIAPAEGAQAPARETERDEVVPRWVGESVDAALARAELAWAAFDDLMIEWSARLEITSDAVLVVLAAGEVGMTACSREPVLAERAALYCRTDDQILLGDPVLRLVVENFGTHALGAVVAHEWGHNLQRELRLPFERVVDAELHADCAAGIWSRSRLDRGLDDWDGIIGAANLFYAIGDFETDPALHHGTPDQRLAAFYQGFSGDSCPLRW